MRPTGSRFATSARSGPVIAKVRSCSWPAALMARSACSLANRAAFGLPLSSTPNSTIDTADFGFVGIWRSVFAISKLPESKGGQTAPRVGAPRGSSLDGGGPKFVADAQLYSCINIIYTYKLYVN